MLHNPQWERNARIHSLDSLIAWLEKKPAHEEYNYLNSNKCLLAEYYTEMYGEPIAVSAHGFYGPRETGDRSNASPRSFWAIAAHLGAGGLKEWNFGAALRRAKLEKEREYAI